MRTRRCACTAELASTPDTIAGASNATCPSPRCDSTTVPSSSHSGSIAANRAIAASCTADATSITRCADPSTPAHCSRDPLTAEVAKAPDSSTSAASHAACTSHRTPGHHPSPPAISLRRAYRRPPTDPRPERPNQSAHQRFRSALSEQTDLPVPPARRPPSGRQHRPAEPASGRAPTLPPPVDSPPRAFEPSSAASFRKNGTHGIHRDVLTRTGRTGHVTTWHKSGRRPRAAASEVAPRRCAPASDAVASLFVLVPAPRRVDDPQEQHP